MRKPKLIYFTNHCPIGQTYGARIRSRSIAEQLSKLTDIHLVVLPLEELSSEQIRETEKAFPNSKFFRFKGRKNSPLDKVSSLLNPNFLNTHGVSAELAAQEYLENAVKDGALLWFFGLRIANAFQFPDSTKAILDIDDIQSQYWRSHYQQASSFKQKTLHAIKVFQWKRREQVLLNRFISLSVCSKTDQNYLTNLGLDGDQITILANGFSLDPKELQNSPAISNDLQIGFIGTLNYEPNRDGVNWFIQEVWDLILEQVPDARLRLVGSKTDSIVGKQVDGLGFVENVSKEIAQWTLTIVPILTGGGTRIKIAEAFCRECPVVSTSLGAFGYNVTNGVELSLADNKSEFAEACIRLMKDPEYASSMTKNAKNLYNKGLSWNALEPNLRQLIKTSVTE